MKGKGRAAGAGAELGEFSEGEDDVVASMREAIASLKHQCSEVPHLPLPVALGPLVSP